jgi:DNA repair ATPase RecN
MENMRVELKRLGVRILRRKPMLLKRIEIRNVRKIKQADIDFHGPGLQVIQGKNKSGKSTLAQSIALTLEGTKALNPGIITHGEEQAEIIAFTDDGLQIKTVIKDSGRDVRTGERGSPRIQPAV